MEKTITDHTTRKPTPPEQKFRDRVIFVTCPKCNRTGEIRYYPKEKYSTVQHVIEYTPGNCYSTVTEHCTITHDQAKELYGSPRPSYNKRYD